MRNSILLCLLILASVMLVTGCKTTEANYKAAYEAAAGKRSEREIESGPVADASGVVGEFLTPVKLHDSDTSVPGLKSSRYYVAANSFRQVFNAKALCRRLIDAGYTNAFVARSPDDEYYVLIDSAASHQEAIALREQIAADTGIPFGRNAYPKLVRPIGR